MTPAATGDGPRKAGLAFEGGTGFLLARVGALARSRWARMLTEQDLTPHQYAMLMALAEAGPLAQHQLCDIVGIDPRNAVPIIDALAAQGFVTRTVDPADRRRRMVELTNTGQRLAHDVTVAGRRVEDDFLQSLDPHEQTELRRMLQSLLRAACAE